jgi:hypothetical protein
MIVAELSFLSRAFYCAQPRPFNVCDQVVFTKEFVASVLCTSPNPYFKLDRHELDLWMPQQPLISIWYTLNCITKLYSLAMT